MTGSFSSCSKALDYRFKSKVASTSASPIARKQIMANWKGVVPCEYSSWVNEYLQAKQVPLYNILNSWDFSVVQGIQVDFVDA